jgi:hypothetical protein
LAGSDTLFRVAGITPGLWPSGRRLLRLESPDGQLLWRDEALVQVVPRQLVLL